MRFELLQRLWRSSVHGRVVIIAQDTARRLQYSRGLVAKELVTIVYAMLSIGEPFNKQFHGPPAKMRCSWPRLGNPPALPVPFEALRKD